jgi:hypothetical protein
MILLKSNEQHMPVLNLLGMSGSFFSAQRFHNWLAKNGEKAEIVFTYSCSEHFPLPIQTLVCCRTTPQVKAKKVLKFKDCHAKIYVIKTKNRKRVIFVGSQNAVAPTQFEIMLLLSQAQANELYPQILRLIKVLE